MNDHSSTVPEYTVTTMSDDPFLFFLHIPKNAGTTLRSILDCQYGRKSVLTYYNQPNHHLLDNLPYMLVDPKRDYRVLVGHYQFGLHKKLAKPSRYVTIVRHPVRRAISAYYENLANHPHKLTRPDGTIMPIDDMVLLEPGEYQNHQIKTLANLPNGVEPDAQSFKMVLSNIADHFEMVGTSERFVESILLIGKRLGWRPCIWGRLNPGPPNPETSAHALDLLRETNVMDQNLYEWSDAALSSAIAAEGPAFTDALNELNQALAQRAEAGHSRLEAELVAETEMPRVAAYWGSRTPAPIAQR